MDGFIQREEVVNGDEDAGLDKSLAIKTTDARFGGRAERVTRLVRTLETDVIPRLALARGAAPDCVSRCAVGGEIPSVENVAEFAQLVLANDAALVCAYTDEMRARGSSLETLYLDLLAPTARHLGTLWDADLCDFTQVTTGLALLQQVLRALPAAFRNDAEYRRRNLRVLLISAPGEQHTFGLSMVAEFFLREGWDVTGGNPTSRNDLMQLVGGEWFDVVGLSAGNDNRLNALASNICDVRKASLNRAVGVMVGGPVFLQRPDFVTLTGADATAVDAAHAPKQARTLLTLLATRYR
jgi:methanogenic corrinoid protein MtbC1